MTDKEKQIEEIANAICSYCKGMTEEECERGKECCEWRLHEARSYYEQGYRKIPEGSVVLSKEEYDELKGRAEEVFNEMTERMKAEIKIEKKMGNRKVEQSRKETAREIIIALVGHTLTEDGWSWTISIEDVKWLTEKYGIEIKEIMKK